jgi:adenylate cyclase
MAIANERRSGLRTISLPGISPGKVVRRFAKFGGARSLALVFLMLLLALRAWDPIPVALVRLKTFDLLQQIQPRMDPARPVMIVDIDEASLNRYGQWPWPRNLVADLLAGITEAGATGIGLDVVFAEPDRASPDVVIEGLPDISPAARREILAVRNYDEILAEVMASSRVVLGESALIDDRQSPYLDAVPIAPFATIGADPDPFLFAFPKLLPNIPELELAAAGRGMFTIKPDSDGTVRRVPLVLKAGERRLAALSLELLRVASEERAILIRSDPSGIQSVAVAGIEVPTDRNARMWIHFSPRDPARYISAIDVIEGSAETRRLDGMLVLLGTSASGLYELRTTPLDPALPGVEVHAQVLENILGRSFLSRPFALEGAEIVVTAIVAIAIILLAPILGPLKVLALGALTAAAGIGTVWYAFDSAKVLIDATFPLGATFAVYAVLVFINYYREEQQRRQIHHAFGQYLSPTLVEELANHPDRLVLGGETRSMTILFSDVRGFTQISESYRTDPQGLTRLMNRFLTPLSNAIIERRGTIDKYMGDAVMAFWNAPLDDPDHAANGCTAALAMLKSVDALNAQREDEARREGVTYREMRIGIGLSTGECVVGNMGSDLRFDYSVLGDTVNLASRLEGQTPAYRVRCVISEATAEAVAGRFALFELDSIRVVGKTQPVRIFALMGEGDLARQPGFVKLVELNGTMLEHYRAGAFAAALDELGRCRELAREFGLDGYFELREERITELLEAPPESWDGVYTAGAKYA